MIFVTVGTHEQQFNRLIQAVDTLKQAGIIKQEVLMQIGYSDYVPVACQTTKMMGYEDMEQAIAKADIVITHGGPGSIFGVLRQKKIPIVVPRRPDFNEHVDMHQFEFVRFLHERGSNIIPVFDIDNLKDQIIRYDSLVRGRVSIEQENKTNDFTVNFRDCIQTLMTNKSVKGIES